MFEEAFANSLPMYAGVKAFYLLQEEIIRTSSFADHSILAWAIWEGAPHVLTKNSFGGTEPSSFQNLLAPSPYGFRDGHDIISWHLPQGETFVLTSKGLRLSLFVQPNAQGNDDSDEMIGILNCRYADQPKSYIVILLADRPLMDECFESKARAGANEVHDRVHHMFRFGNRLKSTPASEVQGKKNRR